MSDEEARRRRERLGLRHGAEGLCGWLQDALEDGSRVCTYPLDHDGDHSFEEAAEPLPSLIFDGSSGKRPQAEARRHVYRIMYAMLDHELSDPEGWMFGGVELEPDKRRLTKAIKAVMAECRKKGK